MSMWGAFGRLGWMGPYSWPWPRSAGVVIATGLAGIVAISVDAWIVAYAGGGSGPSNIEGGGRQEKSSTATQLELGSSDRGEHAHHSCILQSILPFQSLEN